MEMLRQETEPCGKPEQQRQEVGKLCNQPGNQGAATQFMDLIGAVFNATMDRFFRCNPLGTAQQG